MPPLPANRSGPSGFPGENGPSRFVLGMDLGTTNSAVAFVDSLESPTLVQTFSVPQLVAPFEIEARETLPSFHYQPAAGEFSADALKLPWGGAEKSSYIVGAFARDHGATAPGRLIVSAKSWLCHSGVDRSADLLPWHGAADVERLSPVEVSSRYLKHVREAWDHRYPAHPLAEQDFVLTLPASFDEVARELTVAAAARAGLTRVVLIEEPQAAFYAWIHKHAADWEHHVSAGEKILVCDIGGGTSDFTLIRVGRGDDGRLRFHRVAVGEHLILGGDNQDLALAHHLESRLASGGRLEARQWDLLVRACRRAKETLLGEQPPDRLSLNVGSSGARLIGGSLQTEVTRAEAIQVLVEGFLPRVRLEDSPARRRSGFQEFGLPYAADAAVTRYLAAFLTAHRQVTIGSEPLPSDHDPARPDSVLFNGGFFASPALRARFLEVLTSWFQGPAGKPSTDWRPKILDHDRLDLAVARGAAYYGMVRRGEGVRIAAELARCYYVGVDAPADVFAPPSPPLDSSLDSAPPLDPQAAAVCLVPASAEPGREIDLADRRFELLVSQPVEFPLLVSSTRLTDKPGDLVPVDRERMTSLPPIRTVLRTRGRVEEAPVEVRLHARLSEIGTLELWCTERDGPRSWRMQFDVRSATQTDRTAHSGRGEREGFIDEAAWSECESLIEATFGPPTGTSDAPNPTPASPAGAPKNTFAKTTTYFATNTPDNAAAAIPPRELVKRLSAALGRSRNDWPMSGLRRIWEALADREGGRRRSPEHEARWLNLLGFALRPGFGLALDDWRVAETWRLLQGRLVHPAPACQTEWWILWRRIAGGMASGQQRALADPLLGLIRGLHKRLTTGKGGGGDLSFGAGESTEVWRLLGSLELLTGQGKLELGRMLLDLLWKRKMAPVRASLLWTIGRVGARVPLYGPLNVVVPADAAAGWLEELLRSHGEDPLEAWAIMQLARRTADRYRDVPDRLRHSAIDWLAAKQAPPHFVELVREVGELREEEQTRAFGEALPKGLKIV